MPDGASGWPQGNLSSDEIRGILKIYQHIAVVGLSDKPDRPSYSVAAYMQEQGYRITAVNPTLQSFEGAPAYPNLTSIPGELEIVCIFRKPADVPPVVDEAIARKAKVIWMQEGIVHNSAAERARKAGLQVVMNKCMLKEHLKYA